MAEANWWNPRSIARPASGLNLQRYNVNLSAGLRFAFTAISPTVPSNVMNTEERNRLLDVGLRANSESSEVDFKQSFDTRVTRDWCEVVKDIVAFANSGGGVILFGIDDSGRPSGSDVQGVLELDPADVTNKIEKYTGNAYSNFEIIPAERDGHQIACFVAGCVGVPMVFTEAGSYTLPSSTTKTAFATGTVYFRRGAKSEPGTSDDLRLVIEREVERLRRGWLENLRKVIEAPSGASVVVLSPTAVSSNQTAITAVRLTDDPQAPLFREIDPNITHPFRQKEIVEQLNAKIGATARISSHDIYCVRKVYAVETKPSFFYKPSHSSPIYSDAFVDWMIEEFTKDANFFADARLKLQQGLGQALQSNSPRDEETAWLSTYASKFKLSNAALAKKLGYSSATVSLILRGIYKGNAENVRSAIKRLRAEASTD